MKLRLLFLPLLLITIHVTAQQQTREITYDDVFQNRVFSEVDIEGGDVGVFPITMQIPGNVASDTYLLTLKIFKSDSGDCANAQWPATDTPYQGKQFYVKISG